MPMDITLYTIHCPKCKVLEKKLLLNGINYKVIEDENVMREKNMNDLPMLQVGEELFNYSQAISWLNETQTDDGWGECETCKLN